MQKKALMLVNIILDVREPEDTNTNTDDGKAMAEQAWQMRMHWRSEFMRSGLYDCIEVNFEETLVFIQPFTAI